MTDIDVTDRAALSLLLRSKTALGRLVDAEVNAVLDFLESIGFTHQAPAAEPEPIAPAVPDATTIVPPPVDLPPPPAS